MPSERLPVWRTPILRGRISQSLIGSAALGLVALAVLLPLAFTANTALKTPASFAEDNYGLAFPPNFEALLEVWVRARFLEGLQNAVIVAVMGVVMLWVVSCAAAYAITKLSLPRRSLILLLLLSAIAIPIQVIMAPFFNIMRDLGLLDQRIGLALAFCAFGVPINTFMFAAYFRGIPNEIMDAARMDGASSLRVLTHVVLPMSRPVIAATGLLNFIWIFNDLLLPIIVMQSREKQPFVVGLSVLRGDYTGTPTTEAAGALLGILPMLLLYLLAQRQFLRSATMGGLR